MNFDYHTHESVLLKECLEFLCPNQIKMDDEEKWFADLTFGNGGHSTSLAKISKKIKIISTDQDPEAFSDGIKKILENELGNQIFLNHINFNNFHKLVDEKYSVIAEKGGFQGILMDLGVSSHHFDSKERGFSFKEDALLDMRMDISNNSMNKASDIINQFSEEELASIFFNYGEERYSRKIARKIVEERDLKPILMTKQLENIIFHCYPAKSRYGRTHPATRCFQALRIMVNDELSILEKTLPQLANLLNLFGRLVVISFHSLEDRIVKHVFKDLVKNDNSFKILTKKPLTPQKEEINKNFRSRSAKLRVLEKNIVRSYNNDKFKDEC